MVAYGIKAASTTSGLDIVWLAGESVEAYSIQFARNIDFTVGESTYVMKPCTRVFINPGNGAWFFRIGSWVGSPVAGKIFWSTICGPALVTLPPLPAVTVPPAEITLLHTQAITNGMRFHTGTFTPYFTVVDVTRNGTSAGSPDGTNTYYFKDMGHGTIDVGGLEVAHTYNFRIRCFQEGRDTISDTPKLLTSGVRVLNKRCGRMLRMRDSTGTTGIRAGSAIIQDVSQQARINFVSHAHYLRYKATLAAKSEEKVEI
jgi:hypothetical protein